MLSKFVWYLPWKAVSTHSLNLPARQLSQKQDVFLEKSSSGLDLEIQKEWKQLILSILRSMGCSRILHLWSSGNHADLDCAIHCLFLKKHPHNALSSTCTSHVGLWVWLDEELQAPQRAWQHHLHCRKFPSHGLGQRNWRILLAVLVVEQKQHPNQTLGYAPTLSFTGWGLHRM